jgi:hypothetical protein
MIGVVGNFLLIIGAIAIIGELLRNGSATSGVINSLSGLLTGSIKAAQG